MEAHDDNAYNTHEDALRDRDPFYCPGCGKTYLYPALCTGTPALPHAAIQTVDSAELDGDPEHHTPAPDSDAAA